MANVALLVRGLVAGRRYDLAKAITLAESTRPDHREATRHLLRAAIDALQDQSHPLAARGASLRIGLSGSPGVGKSTLIEALGLHIVSQGHRVAVLAVDPSSARSGGSILGDKTRMLELSRHDDAFVRPSPTRGTLGGVARNTNEAIILSAGYDVVLIETVGVGQSETIVADMVDMFVLLVPPAGGDELQGIKRGIMELADLILVTKADGDLVSAARAAQSEYTSALKFIQPRTEWWRPKVLGVSALTKTGVASAWSEIIAYHKLAKSTGALWDHRGEQNKSWMWHQVQDDLISRLEGDQDVQRHLHTLADDVYTGRTTPGEAADLLVATFLSSLWRSPTHDHRHG